MFNRSDYADWRLDETKYLSETEVRRLRSIVAPPYGRPLADVNAADVREWFLIETGLSTGLRVMEIASLRCGDLDAYEPKPVLRVAHGKGDRARAVLVGKRYLDDARRYLAWKAAIGEPAAAGAPLFASPRGDGPMSTRALQYMFKRALADSGLRAGYSIHCLRHTYAVFLYRASSHNARFVQKQLGHASIRTTQIYMDALLTDSREALERLYA